MGDLVEINPCFMLFYTRPKSGNKLGLNLVLSPSSPSSSHLGQISIGTMGNVHFSQADLSPASAPLSCKTGQSHWD